jgi:hypothetical protein
VLGASTSLLYVPGFVVVNAYMATKGVTEQPLLSSRYVAAGGLFIVASLFYYFLVLKPVVHRARDGIAMNAAWPSWFHGFVHNYFFLEALFRAAYFSAWLVAITTPSAASIAALLLTTVIGAVDGVIFARRWLSPISRFLVSAGALVVGLLGFGFLCVLEPTMLGLSTAATLFLVAVTTVMTSVGWRSGDDRSWGMVYLSVYGLLAAVAFGATTYGGIAAKYGGGAPVKVQVVLSASAEDQIRKALEGAKAGVYLLASTDDALFLETRANAQHKSTTRIERGQVSAIMFETASTAEGFHQAFEQLAAWIRSAPPASSTPAQAPVPAPAASLPASTARGTGVGIPVGTEMRNSGK